MTQARHGWVGPLASVAALAAVLGLLTLGMKWLRTTGDRPEPPGLLDLLRSSADAKRAEAVFRRTREKAEVGRALGEGEITFAQAFARFRELDAALPPQPDGEPLEDAALCRAIVTYGCLRVRDRPEELAREERRLEEAAELFLAARWAEREGAGPGGDRP